MSGTELAAVTSAPPDLAGWADNARAVHQIALSLAATSFVPKTMQGRPEEVTGAILAGQELGLSPMAALRSIDIIDGVPAVRAVALRGLVLAHGHDIWVEESTDTRAVVCGRRAAGRTAVQRSVWTMDRARKANLANKRNWQAHPAAMLVARATAEVARLIAADVLIALPYVLEEIGDDDTADAAGEANAGGRPTRRHRVQRSAPPPAAPPAERDQPVKVPYHHGYELPDGPSVDDYPRLSDHTRRALMATFRDAGLDDRDQRLRYASAFVGRQLSTANELTETEAAAIAAQLRSTGPAQPPTEPAPRGPDPQPESESGPEPGDDGWPVVARPPDAPQLDGVPQ